MSLRRAPFLLLSDRSPPRASPPPCRPQVAAQRASGHCWGTRAIAAPSFHPGEPSAEARRHTKAVAIKSLLTPTSTCANLRAASRTRRDGEPGAPRSKLRGCREGQCLGRSLRRARSPQGVPARPHSAVRPPRRQHVRTHRGRDCLVLPTSIAPHRACQCSQFCAHAFACSATRWADTPIAVFRAH